MYKFLLENLGSVCLLKHTTALRLSEDSFLPPKFPFAFSCFGQIRPETYESLAHFLVEHEDNNVVLAHQSCIST